jgi:hypothetical protein
MMDDSLGYLRAYLVREARRSGRWAVDAASNGDPAAQVSVTKAAFLAKQFETLINHIDELQRDPRTWAVKQGLVVAEAQPQETEQ